MDDKIEVGMKVRTREELGNAEELFVKEEYLRARREGVVGTIYGYVPGHGGDASG